MGSPMPRSRRPFLLSRSTNACDRGMIHAGFEPTSAMSANSTAPASDPSSARRAWSCAALVITRTGSPTSSPSLINGTAWLRKSAMPRYSSASCRNATCGSIRLFSAAAADLEAGKIAPADHDHDPLQQGRKAVKNDATSVVGALRREHECPDAADIREFHATELEVKGLALTELR